MSETGRIYDCLVTKFGRERVFKDVDNIPFGSEFSEYIEQAVNRCQVLLVVIGRTWTTATETDSSRRLDNPNDFVRIEIESALKLGVPVIPLLMEGVSMPEQNQLPESLQPIIKRNGLSIGHDPRFHSDMDRLIQGIQLFVRPTEALGPTFSFETVSVDNRGNEVRRLQLEAEYRRESLAPDIHLDLVLIPRGSFQMGSPLGQGTDSQRPQHMVTLRSFLIGKYPVTQVQWRAVAAFPKVRNDLNPDPSSFKNDDRPVENVSWSDAIEFCRRLRKHTDRKYRLPSEAEWEYACRARTQTPFYYGETLTSKLANYDATEIYGTGPFGSYRNRTTKVGIFPANKFGIFDMHGNVGEWCHDHYHDTYKDAPNDGSAWTSPGMFCWNRIIRGGSWDDVPYECTSAYRLSWDSDERFDTVGFRVACDS